MIRRRTLLVTGLAIALLVTAAIAQRRGRWRREFRPDGYVDRNGVPEWKNDERFKSDVFTFVRVRYGSRYDGWGHGGWDTDYPDSDLNFSYRLHQLTALETDPNGKILELTDDAIFDHPFLYMIEPGRLYLSDVEALNLRRYLLNGGFLMVDDFWGEAEWDNFEREFAKVFPDRRLIELPLEHEIFHIVYDLKEKPQVPSIHAWESGMMDEGRWDAQTPHYRGVFDDKQRLMAIVCHNTDLGDGWEREGENVEYFKQMAERWSYPLGINIVTYAMTH
jgi:hypothetical protein